MQKTSIERFVLDAWALLAMIQGEAPPASKVLRTSYDAKR